MATHPVLNGTIDDVRYFEHGPPWAPHYSAQWRIAGNWYCGPYRGDRLVPWDHLPTWQEVLAEIAEFFAAVGRDEVAQ